MTTYANGNENALHAHAQAYHRFTLAVKWFAIHLVALVVFLTLWFATSIGFWSALLAGVVVFGAGVFAMRHGMARSSELAGSDGARSARRFASL